MAVGFKNRDACGELVGFAGGRAAERGWAGWTGHHEARQIGNLDAPENQSRSVFYTEDGLSYKRTK